MGEIMRRSILAVCVVSLWFSSAGNAYAVYDLDPGRKIAWRAGLDTEGGIPYYPNVTCNGLDPTGASDSAAKINACISSAVPGTAVYLPSGTYRVNSHINMKSNRVLRGAGPAQTSIRLYNGAQINFNGGSKDGMGSNIAIVSGYVKGSTALTLASAAGLATGDIISIFQDNDPALVKSLGCSWCGEDSGQHEIQQFAKVAGVAGNIVTISPGMYLTYSANPQIKKAPMSVRKAGLEDLKVELMTSNGWMIYSGFSAFNWLRNIESYNAGGSSGCAHVRLEFSFGWEIRDSYFHHGQNYGSGASYGVFLIFWNSAHKIENNRFYFLRHGVNFEGGGSGTAVLYNYFDAHREAEDPSYLDADLNPNHGPHPHMNLYEGNISAKITHDYTFGSSSHNTAFRNHVRGTRSVPPVGWGVWAIDTQAWNRYMNFVGNVLGMPSWTSGTAVANGQCGPPEPTAIKFGCDGQPGTYTDSLAYSTAVLHGNYDYVTDGVANWAGADHVLKNSMYYDAKPGVGSWWCEETPWPPIGPDVPNLTNDIPAKRKQDGASCTIPYIKKPLPPYDIQLNK